MFARLRPRAATVPRGHAACMARCVPHREERRRLREEHHAERINARLSERRGHSYLGDAVLGAIDGCVTTFAVVAGSVGAQFPGVYLILLP